MSFRGIINSPRRRTHHLRPSSSTSMAAANGSMNSPRFQRDRRRGKRRIAGSGVDDRQDQCEEMRELPRALEPQRLARDLLHAIRSVLGEPPRGLGGSKAVACAVQAGNGVVDGKTGDAHDNLRFTLHDSRFTIHDSRLFKHARPCATRVDLGQKPLPGGRKQDCYASYLRET
jgi:hypothetical protein